MKFDLEVVNSFSDMLGNPQNSFRSVHVAGTNGKGSTSALIYSVLNLKKKTGLYTSPHLVKFNERIISGGETISDERIESFILNQIPSIERLKENNRNPTFFEVTTLMAFDFFRESHDKWAAIEVGLGGRLDATNIITPEMSVITQIGYEHASILGGTLTAIAREKAGIIKNGVPAVTGETKPEPLNEINRVARLKKSKLIISSRYCAVSGRVSSLEGNTLRVTTPVDTYEISTSIPGKLQIANVVTAIAALENLPDPPGRIDVERGIREARWPGRIEVVRRDPVVIIDAAHNPSAAWSMVRSLKELISEEPILVVGQLKDKDHFSFLTAVRQLSGSIILTTPDEETRAENPEKLLPIAKELFREVRVISDPREAYAAALSTSRPVLVTGSIYLIGIIKEAEKSSLNPFK